LVNSKPIFFARYANAALPLLAVRTMADSLTPTSKGLIIS